MDVRRRHCLFALSGGALLLALPACRKATLSEGAGQVGEAFPLVSLPDFDGRMQSLAAYQGVALVVNFWASWCAPCRREMPSLDRLGKFFLPTDLRVIGIAVDSDVNLAREFGLHYQLNFPLWLDSDRAVAEKTLHIPVFPITYLLNREHKIMRVVMGEQDWSGAPMLADIQRLLNVSMPPEQATH
jgi:thiol-disulfide isomerase/thioredoxin